MVEPRAPAFPGGEEPPETNAPRQLGDFELVREIGRGGMGIVYEARQTSLHRTVAVKVLPPGLGLTAQAVQRFHREAQAAAQLHHTHIVPVYAVGEEAGCHYYAMELIEGQPLTEILRELRGGQGSPLLEAAATRIRSEPPLVPGRAEPPGDETRTVGSPPQAPAPPSRPGDRRSHESTSFSDTTSGSRHWFDTVATLLAHVADALHYAHGRGVVHRDVKPANLLLSGDGRLCVTDFGLAQVAQDPGMTVSGSFLGTPAYMSPEQIAAGRIKVDHRTDVYSLGVVLYEVLTLVRPFPGDDRDQILAGIMTKEPRPPRRINPRIPADLETICLKALEKDPDRRYATAREMANDLRAYVQHGLIRARRAGPLRRGAKWARRHPVSVAVALGILTISVLTFTFGTWNAGERARRAVAEAQVLLGEGEYRKGLALVDAALKLTPGLAEGRRVRAQALFHTGHWGEAASEAEQLVKQSPEDWVAHAVLGASARMGWVMDVDVEGEARAVERLAPKSADAFYLRALVTEDAKERLRLLDKALELDPSYTLALFSRADALAEWKDFAGARAAAQQALVARPRSARGRRGLAITSWNAGDLGRALDEFGKAIALDPGDPVTYSKRGLLEADMGKTKEALADLNRAIELDPGRAMGYFDRVYALGRLGRHEEVVADARRVLELSPGYTWASDWLLFALAKLNRKKEYEQTLLTLEATASRHGLPEHREESYRAIAFARSRIGDYQRALAAADMGIRARPGSPNSYVARMQIMRGHEGETAVHADCERLAGLSLTTPEDYHARAEVLNSSCRRPDLALADCNRLIELAPQWGEAFQQRGQLRREERQFAAALSDFARAIELTPWNAPTYQARGLVFADLERYEDALKDYDRAVALGMNASDVRRSQASALIRLDRGEEALRALDETQWPNPAAGWLAKAWALKDLGRVEEATVAADKAIAGNPGDPWGYLARGSAQMFLKGRCGSAIADYQKALALEPENVSVGRFVALQSAQYIAWACPERYDAALALHLAERAVRSDPKSHFFQRALAFVEFRLGNLARARQSAEEAIRLTKLPGHEFPSDRFLLAMIDARMGNRRQAREEFDQGVRRTKQYFRHDPGTISLRDEAAGMIGAPPR